MTVFTRKDAIATKTVFSGHIITVRVDDVRTVAGEETTREVVEHPGGVVIVGMPSEDEVLLVKQYRYSVDRELLELPAGRLEEGEDPLVAARRELAEETGYEAASWTERGYMFPAVGFCNEKLTWFVASGLSWVGKSLDDDEETDVVKLSLDEAWKLVMDGKVPDTKTVAILGILYNERS